MGWWHQDTEGRSFAAGSNLYWGDGPADIVDQALDRIRAQFREDLGREPTIREIRAGLEFTLRALEDDLDDQAHDEDT